VTHLVLDFRMDVVRQQIQQLQQALRLAGNDMTETRRLLSEIRERQELKNALAQRLGSNS
jgi:hypothetical protein